MTLPLITIREMETGRREANSCNPFRDVSSGACHVVAGMSFCLKDSMYQGLLWPPQGCSVWSARARLRPVSQPLRLSKLNFGAVGLSMKQGDCTQMLKSGMWKKKPLETAV